MTIGIVIEKETKAVGIVPTVEEIKNYILTGEKDNEQKRNRYL